MYQIIQRIKSLLLPDADCNFGVIQGVTLDESGGVDEDARKKLEEVLVKFILSTMLYEGIILLELVKFSGTPVSFIEQVLFL